MTSNIAVYPMTTLVTRIQSGQTDLLAGGVRGLYRGALSSIGSVPSSAVRQFAKEISRELLSKLRFLASSQVQVLSGVAGATAACVVVVPRELIRKQMQVYGETSTMWITARTILDRKGGLGLFQGWQETLSREIPFFVINFYIVDTLKERLERKHGRQPNTQELFFTGALAGAVAAAITTPCDVIQTIKMTNEMYAGKSALATAISLARDRGPPALFTGCKLRVAAVAPLHAVWWMVYELCLQAARYRSPVYPDPTSTCRKPGSRVDGSR